MRAKKTGSALLLTLIVILGLTLEVAIISLVLIRGLGSEGLLAGQNIQTRRAAEIAVNRLRDKIMNDLNTLNPSDVLTHYGYGGGSAISNMVLTVDNPDGGTSNTATIDAWVDSKRGDLYHLVGRARYGSSDILVHRWTMMKSCGGGTLFTILTDGKYPGREMYMNRKIMTSDGRAYIWENSNPGRFWTWAESTGLSTILSSGGYSPGYSSTVISPVDGRVFFGNWDNPGKFWTWHPSTGLSTIISNAAGIESPGGEATTIAGDGRVYFGGYSNYLWTWKAGVLSTIINDTYGHPGAGALAVGPDGRFFFGEQAAWSGKRFATWKDNGTASGALTVLQTAGTNIRPGSWLSTKVAGDGRVFWGQETSPGNVYTWKEGEPIGATPLLPGNMASPGTQEGMVTAQDGRVFFGEFKNTSARYWSWKSGSGLTTILTNSTNPGHVFGAVVDSTNRVYFGDESASGSLWSWKEGVGLTTIVSGNGGYYAVKSSIAIAPDDRIFFGGQNKNFYTYKEGVGLSTIISGNTYNLGYMSTKVAPNGRVFFGEDTGASPTGKFYTWKADTGLSVIVTGAKSPGKDAIDVSDNGYVFFAESASPGKAWAYRINDCAP